MTSLARDYPELAALPEKADRRTFVGGSDIPAIIGQSPYKDAFALYLEKRGEIEAPEVETKVQRRGKLLEPAIAAMYADEGAELERGVVLQMPGTPHFRAQIDAIEIVDNTTIPVEIKSASEFTRDKWGQSGTDEAPTGYCAQLHWQIHAMGAPFGRIVALLGADDLRVYTIERDPKIAEFLLKSAAEFWLCVQAGTPPEVNFAHPSVGDTLARLFNSPRATEILQADDRLRAWRDVYVDAVHWKGKYETVADGAKAHMLAAMRNAGVIDFGDGQSFERRIIKRKGYTVGETTFVEGRLRKSKAGGAPALSPPEE